MAPAIASAGIVPAEMKTDTDGRHTWTYSPAATGLPAGPGRGDGGSFTIYGFAGYVAGSCVAPEHWRCTAKAPALGEDGLVDLTWIHFAPASRDRARLDADPGTFSARSVLAGSGALDYMFWSAGQGGWGEPAGFGSAGTTLGPTAQATTTVHEVPVPQTLSLAGLGLLLGGVAGRRSLQRRRVVPLRWAAALGAALLASVATAAGPGAGAARDAQARYQQERAACLDGRTHQTRADCLREAGAAYAEARRGRLEGSDADADYAANRVARCAVFKVEDDYRACLARMGDAGTTSGSVEGGGILREHRELVIGETPASNEPPAQPDTTAPVPPGR